MRLILEVTSGPFQGKRIEAESGQTVSVGRTPKSDVAFEDNFLSGRHFAIECGLRSCRLRDLKSRNGTKLNGELITDATLKEGDQVHAGRTDFVVKIEDPLKTIVVAPGNSATVKLTPSESEALAQSQPPPKEQPQRPTAAKAPEASRSGGAPQSRTSPEALGSTSFDKIELPDVAPPPPAASERAKGRQTVGPRNQSQPVPPQPSTPPVPIRSSPPQSMADVLSPVALDSYEAATPEGRLLQILSNQPEPLMALIDAAHDPKVLELLRAAHEEYQSLYRNEQNAAIAPYLVRLPPRSDLLKQMVQQGWGRGWGVYLTCPLSLAELRDYFRSSLLVTMPDGMELFSRFYDPRFFRSFLESCNAAEAEKFFGPITSYLMEDERSEILLQFKRGRKGPEKKGHLLSVLV